MLPFTTQSMTGLPGLELQGLITLILQFFIAMLRIGAFLISSPLLGARWVPLQVRLTMSMMLTIVIWEYTTPVSAEVLTSYHAILIVFSEIIIGLCLLEFVEQKLDGIHRAHRVQDTPQYIDFAEHFFFRQ